MCERNLDEFCSTAVISIKQYIPESTTFLGIVKDWFMDYLGKLLIIERLISLVLLIIIFFIFFSRKERLLQDKARIKFREKRTLMYIAVALGLLSLYTYILSEIALTLVDVGYLPASFEELHGAFEFVHLGLIMISLAIGVFLVWIVSGDD